MTWMIKLREWCNPQICFRGFVIVLFATVTFGCATIQPSLITKYMTQSEVRSQFGTPLYVRTAKLKDGRQIEEWEYVNKGIPKTRTVMFFNSKRTLIYWQEYRPWAERPKFNLPNEVFE